MLTCAHVWAAAQGDRDIAQRQVAPPGKINVRKAFPLGAGLQDAVVSSWSSDTLEGADAAVLSVPAAMDASRQLPFATAAESSGSLFQVFGYKSGRGFGVWARGRIGDLNPRGWFEMVGIDDHGFFLQPGFSGSPVWDVSRQACVGIVKAVEENADLRVAYLLPLELLERKLTRSGEDTLIRTEPFDAAQYRLVITASQEFPAERDLIASKLASRARVCADPTERYWIYEALGGVGGSVAAAEIRQLVTTEQHPFALTGLKTAAQRLGEKEAFIN
jgi:hypothetical protein